MSRVCRVLPPRRHAGAASSSNTDAPASRAVIAATSPALPPPTTTTSGVVIPSVREISRLHPRREYDDSRRCHPELAIDLTSVSSSSSSVRHIPRLVRDDTRGSSFDERELQLDGAAALLAHAAPGRPGSPAGDVEPQPRAGLARFGGARASIEPFEEVLSLLCVRPGPTTAHQKHHPIAAPPRDHGHRRSR